jgi:hypothetical protein
MSKKHSLTDKSSLTYSHLYFALVDYFVNDMTVGIVTAIFAPSYFFMMVGLSVNLAGKITEGFNILSGIITIIGVTSFYLFLYFMVFVLRVNLRYPKEVSPHIASFLIIGIKRPTLNETGLDYKSIQKLKRISETEQNSAEWRSNFLNIVVIGLAAFTIANISNMDTSLLSFELRYFQLKDVSFAFFVLMFAVSMLATWFFYNLFAYLREFLGSAAVNRMILLACEESLIILEEMKLEEDEHPNFSEKQSFIEKMGCKLVESKSRHRNELVIFPPVRDAKGNHTLQIASEKKERHKFRAIIN